MNTAVAAHQERYSVGTRLASLVLGLLAPGLGQILQGVIGRDFSRFAKGAFFLVSLWGMFFYGMWLGRWQNVYLPHFAEPGLKPVVLFNKQLPPLLGNLYTRLHYVGQFWIGAAAWPALWHYYVPESPLFGDFQSMPPRYENLEERKTEIKKQWAADPRNLQFELGRLHMEALEKAQADLNKLQYELGKTWDIAWVYTVVAGVLNILVLYDAWAGPMFARREPAPAPAPSLDRRLTA